MDDPPDANADSASAKLPSHLGVDFKLKATNKFNSNYKLRLNYKVNSSLTKHIPPLLYIVIVVVCLLVEVAEGTFYNEWAVEVVGGRREADAVAKEHGFVNTGQIGSLENFYLFVNRRVVKRAASRSVRWHRKLKNERKVKWWKQQEGVLRVQRAAAKKRFTDPMWDRMWYLNRKGNNMNVMGAWNRGYTGKGVVVSVLDDGIEHNHTDLAANYDPKASFDFLSNDSDPMPMYGQGYSKSHGTRCAGEVAAVANNRKCMVGVAYNAKIGGIRMLDGEVTDAVEASAFSFRPDHIDIYSSSWGPDDTGTLVNGPGKLAVEAFKNGVTKVGGGRNGKGSIYVWASGNGGSSSDSCGCDGYVNSIYTLSVAGVSESGSKPWYLEECASILATTYSSGDNAKERKILTTDLNNSCGVHTGTSSSAAMASGMFALALQANGNLTWRDMQYIVILTSRTSPFKKPEWVVNGVGRLVSHSFGYGLMDGLAMTMLAEKWVTVPDQHKCYSEYYSLNQTFNKALTTTIVSSGCLSKSNEINHLEHVQATVWLQYGRRGDLKISLTSPNGTTSVLLSRRTKDMLENGFKNWTFMSVFYWGEHPKGQWKLKVENDANSDFTGTFYGWRLIFYGTQTDPIGVRDFNYTNIEQPDHNYDYENDEEEEDEEKQLNQINATLTSIISKSDSSVFQAEDNDTSGEERKCHVECKDDRCDGPGNSNCTSCKHFQMHLGGACIRECPAGTYANVDSYTCQRCLDPCLECVLVRNYINIFKHPPISSQQQELIISSYDPSSDDPTYPTNDPDMPSITSIMSLSTDNSSDGSYDETSGEDLEAISNNSMQTGHAQIELKIMCTACQPSHLLLLRNNESICVKNCIKGYYPDTSQKQCLPCSKGCKECVRVKECLRCKSKYELIGTHCLPVCHKIEFRHKNNSCLRCHEHCLSCSGEDKTDCVMCAPDRMWEKNLCVKSCSVGFYRVNMLNKEPNCEMCDSSCKGCLGGLNTQCTSCNPPLILHKQTCIRQCPEGFYEGNGSVCMPCHEQCVNCKGPNKNDCFECKHLKRLHQGDCLASCPEGTFRTNTDKATGRSVRRCDKCHSSCKTCKSESRMHCITCHSDRLFSYGQCLENCRENEYRQENNCLTCHEACYRCDGASEFHCTKCTIDRYMMGSRCVSKCPEGTQESANTCTFCPLGCAQCQGDSPVLCLRCSQGEMSESGLCPYSQPECPAKQFFDEINRACLGCHPSCSKCTGNTSNDCLSCPESMGLWQSVCHPCCSESLRTHCCVCQSASGVCKRLVDTEADNFSETFDDVTEPTTATSLTTFTSTPLPTPSTTTSLSTIVIHETTEARQSTSILESSSSTASLTSTTSTPSHSNTTLVISAKDMKPSAPPEPHSFSSLLVACLIVFFFIAIALVLAFGLSHLKSRHKLCWSNQYYKTVATKPQHDMSTGKFTNNSPRIDRPVPV